MENDKKTSKENRTLYIYTGLIFLVAVVLIIIAFFGQEKLAKEQPVQPEQTASAGITEKAAVLSEENRLLLGQVNTLKDEIIKITEEKDQLQESVKTHEEQKENTEKLISCYEFCIKGEFKQAEALYETLDINYITENLKPFYDDIGKKIRERKK
jgi:hypothetical protein